MTQRELPSINESASQELEEAIARAAYFLKHNPNWFSQRYESCTNRSGSSFSSQQQDSGIMMSSPELQDERLEPDLPQTFPSQQFPTGSQQLSQCYYSDQSDRQFPEGLRSNCDVWNTMDQQQKEQYPSDQYPGNNQLALQPRTKPMVIINQQNDLYNEMQTPNISTSISPQRWPVLDSSPGLFHPSNDDLIPPKYDTESLSSEDSLIGPGGESLEQLNINRLRLLNNMTDSFL